MYTAKILLIRVMLCASVVYGFAAQGYAQTLNVNQESVKTWGMIGKPLPEMTKRFGPASASPGGGYTTSFLTFRAAIVGTEKVKTVVQSGVLGLGPAGVIEGERDIIGYSLSATLGALSKKGGATGIAIDTEDEKPQSPAVQRMTFQYSSHLPPKDMLSFGDVRKMLGLKEFQVYCESLSDVKGPANFKIAEADIESKRVSPVNPFIYIYTSLGPNKLRLKLGFSHRSGRVAHYANLHQITYRDPNTGLRGYSNQTISYNPKFSLDSLWVEWAEIKIPDDTIVAWTYGREADRLSLLDDVTKQIQTYSTLDTSKLKKQ